MAIALSGQLLLGQPVMVKPSEAEKNLVQSNTSGGAVGVAGPYGAVDRKLYVGNLHFNMTETHLREVLLLGLSSMFSFLNICLLLCVYNISNCLARGHFPIWTLIYAFVLCVGCPIFLKGRMCWENLTSFQFSSTLVPFVIDSVDYLGHIMVP